MQSENLEKLTINYLTETEYAQAKANGELKDNELYMTPDDNGFGSVDVYSYNEVKTNKIWVNGKPIYRRILETQTTQTDMAHNIANIDEITNIETLLKQPSGMFSRQDGSVTFINKTIYVVYGQVNGLWKVFVEYTKTTD